ncbi:MAG: hypothetical protein EB119_10945, partial [Synechococcaceae bacterium WBB_34_004]|nr:hypothetical protein [Synechococcaceae bacterium WBB_34_004]
IKTVLGGAIGTEEAMAAERFRLPQQILPITELSMPKEQSPRRVGAEEAAELLYSLLQVR